MNYLNKRPSVSAVIPTRNRPELVCRAVESALDQTYDDLEVVVVVDGPDEITTTALNDIGSSRVRVLQLTTNVGGSEARNIGVRVAKGQWIAFLDDDDEWLPSKVSKQMEIVSRSNSPNLMVACKYVNRDGICETILPSNVPGPDENLSEFLFCRCSVLGTRLGFIGLPTWLVPKDLLFKLPFTRGLKANQDTDWILRAAQIENFKIAFVDEPLVAVNAEQNRARIGSAVAKGRIDWTYSFEWAINNRTLFTPKAFSFFLLTVPCAHALSQHQLSRAISLAAKSIWSDGRITPRLTLIAAKYVLLSLLPESNLRKKLGQAVYSLAMARYKT